MAVHELKRNGKPDFADELRALADDVESGKVAEVFVVANDAETKEYRQYGDFDDRVRVIGMLEMMKMSVGRS